VSRLSSQAVEQRGWWLLVTTSTRGVCKEAKPVWDLDLKPQQYPPVVASSSSVQEKENQDEGKIASLYAS